MGTSEIILMLETVTTTTKYAVLFLEALFAPYG